MPAAVPDKSSGPAGGSSGAFRTSRAAYADINRQLGSFYEDTAGGNGGRARDAGPHRGTGTPPGRTAGAEETAQEEQVALLEMSYEIAARYMTVVRPLKPASESLRFRQGFRAARAPGAP